MSFETDRNPSPPPEILSDEAFLPDRIGNSVYSKQWLYKALIKILKWCENPTLPQKKNRKSLDTPPKIPVKDEEIKPISNPEDAVDMMELDSEIEGDACILWDMSATKEVAEFLNESECSSIFLDIIDKTKSPRLLEIIVGVIGNMSTFDAVCLDFSQNKNLRDAILSLTGTSDTPTLLQVFRVVLCGVSNKNCQNLWFESFEEKPVFMENMKFVFENSLSNVVLKDAFRLLTSMLNENINYCKMWGQDPYGSAVIEASKQLMSLSENLDNVFCVLCSLCQYTPNIKEFAKSWMDLQALFIFAVKSLEDDDDFTDISWIGSTISLFDSYNTFLKSGEVEKELVFVDIDALKSMRRLSSCVSSLLSDLRRDSGDASNGRGADRPLQRVEERNGVRRVTMVTDEEFQSLEVLNETLNESAKVLETFAEKENEKEILEDILKSEMVKENET